MMITKVLYISYDGMTDPLGQSQVIPYLKGLAEKEFEIHILSFEKPQQFLREHHEISQTLINSKIQWHPLKYTASPPIFSTLKDVMAMKRKATQLHKKHQFHIVHARSYISALAAMHMKEKFGTKFVFDMRGFWADERVDGNIWNLRNPLYKMIYKYFKRKEKEFLQHADHTIGLTEAAVPALKKISNNPQLNVEVIPCCADLKHFDYNNFSKDTSSSTRAQRNIPQHSFVLSYLGSIGTWYMLDEMLDFFVALKKHVQNASLLFITKENKQGIIAKAKEKGICESDVFVFSANRKEVPELLSTSDANIFFIKPCFSKSASSPTKLAEVLGMGIPVVANGGVGDVEKHIEESGVGLIVKDFQNEHYEKIVRRIHILNDIEKQQCRLAAQKNYDLTMGLQKYEAVYNKLCEE